GRRGGVHAGGAFDDPVREAAAPLPRQDLIDAERHRPVATACPERPRGFRRIRVKAGRQYAREGEVFAFEPRELHVERCEDVEIELENNDEIRHDLMIPGLNPTFALNFVGPDVERARSVTPAADVTLSFPRRVAAHGRVGRVGALVVGKAGAPQRLAPAQAPREKKAVQGVGVVIATAPRAGRLIVNPEEIRNFMAAMEMSYPVASPSLLNGINPGDKISFTIAASQATITAIEVIERARRIVAP